MQIDSTTTRAVRAADETHVWITADLEPFQQAIDTAVRQLAEATQMSPDVLNPDPDGPTSADWLRSHDPIQVAWRDPAMPTNRLRHEGGLSFAEAARNAAAVRPALAAAAMSFAGLGDAAAEVREQDDRLRACFPDAADEAIATARELARTSWLTYRQAVDKVIDDFTSRQDAERRIRDCWRRLLDRWKGQP